MKQRTHNTDRTTERGQKKLHNLSINVEIPSLSPVTFLIFKTQKPIFRELICVKKCSNSFLPRVILSPKKVNALPSRQVMIIKKISSTRDTALMYYQIPRTNIEKSPWKELRRIRTVVRKVYIPVVVWLTDPSKQCGLTSGNEKC